MSYSTFNGWTIIPPPASPGFRSIVLRTNDKVAESQPSFIAKPQMYVWPGSDWWEADIGLPPLLPSDAGAWQAWLAALQGKANAFEIGDPSRPVPLLPLTGSSPVVNNGGGANNLPRSSSLVTVGWRASQPRLMLPGTYLQIGYRLHMVLQQVASDSGGNATINVWPTLREQPTDASAVILNNPKGLFRLAENARQVSVAVTKLSAVGFKCVEAL